MSRVHRTSSFFPLLKSYFPFSGVIADEKRRKTIEIDLCGYLNWPLCPRNNGDGGPTSHQMSSAPRGNEFRPSAPRGTEELVLENSPRRE